VTDQGYVLVAMPWPANFPYPALDWWMAVWPLCG